LTFSKLLATPVAPPIVPRPVAAPTVPASSAVTSNTTGSSAAALSQPASSATSRLVAGMSPAGNIPSGASDQEKVYCSKKHFHLLSFLLFYVFICPKNKGNKQNGIITQSLYTFL